MMASSCQTLCLIRLVTHLCEHMFRVTQCDNEMIRMKHKGKGRLSRRAKSRNVCDELDVFPRHCHTEHVRTAVRVSPVAQLL